MVLDQQEQSEKLIEEFGRQILVPGINEEGQLNISKKKICIIGLGALGTVASQYLVRAGVGEIHLVDYDIIEKSNLHRQINYDKDDVGKSKSNTSKHNGLFSSLFCAKYMPSEELIDMDTNEILFALEYFEEKILF